MDDITKARLATILDCEGAVCIIKSAPKTKYHCISPTYCGRVLLSMVPDVFILEFQKYFGGAIKRRHKNPKWRPQYCWSIGGQKAYYLLVMLFPFLRLKKKQAALVIGLNLIREEAKKNRLWGPGRPLDCSAYEDLYSFSRELNKRGL